MLLYHFTCAQHLDSIRSEGLTRGDVPLDKHQALNAVWLTRDRKPSAQGWAGIGQELSDEAKLKLKNAYGIVAPDSAHYANKQEIRITVKIPRNDRNLIHWPVWARKRLAPDWYHTLNEVGGGGAKDWYLYWGIIPADWFEEIETLAP